MDIIRKLSNKKNQTNRIKRQTTILSDKSPFSFVESYNALRTNLNFIASANDAQTFFVTSSLPDEGKTTVAINLAVSLAKDNKKVIIIDADLRKPSLQRYLNVKHGFVAGLSDVLANQVTLESCIYKNRELDIHVMLAGTRPPNPTELLALPKMKEVIEDLEDEYDYIIFDTPPIWVITDAAVMSKYTDGAIFVIRQDHSKQEIVEGSIDHLRRVDCPIHGIVLNNYKVEQDFSKNASEQEYYYYYYGE